MTPPDVPPGASDLDYSDEELAGVLAEVDEFVGVLRHVSPDRLRPFTEPILQLHHLAATIIRDATT